MGTIFNIQRYCLHDGDGIRTTVFFKGCPLRCIWCHNPEGLSTDISVSYNREKCTLCGRCLLECNAREIVCSEVIFDRKKCRTCGRCEELCLSGANELFGREVSVDEVMEEVVKDKIYYKTSGGGMTLSGGEPSMQADFALELIRRAKDEGIRTSLETCGIGSRDFYKKAYELGASFLFDLKCFDSEKHERLTGVGNEKIISNLLYLFEVGADVIVRMPLVPGVNDLDEDIAALARFLKKHEGGYRYAQIMPYHSFGVEKARRLGNDEAFVVKDASADDKARWIELFFAHGIDAKI